MTNALKVRGQRTSLAKLEFSSQRFRITLFKSIIDGKMNVFKDFIPIRIFELTLAIDLPDEIEDEIPKKRIRNRFWTLVPEIIVTTTRNKPKISLFPWKTSKSKLCCLDKRFDLKETVYTCGLLVQVGHYESNSIVWHTVIHTVNKSENTTSIHESSKCLFRRICLCHRNQHPDWASLGRFSSLIKNPGHIDFSWKPT